MVRGWQASRRSVKQMRGAREDLPDPLVVRNNLARTGRGWTAEEALVVEHLRCADHRGSDVRLSSGALTRPSCWPRMSTDHTSWKWRTVVKTKWEREAHINELELRAALLALRWRLRSLRGQKRVALHLLDSSVSIGVLVKRRSSAYRLHRVVRRINALELASGTRVILGFVRSAVNPADAPSRS